MTKRRLRSLTKKCAKKTFAWTFYKNKYITTTVLLLIFYVIYSNEEYKKEFQQNLNTFLYKSNYCLNENYNMVFKEVKREILNQDTAIIKIEKEFKNYANKFRSIAIIGSSGVGKTMLANILLNKFPWRENIQNYIWTTYTSIENKYTKINEFVDNICDCGTNLIIIDDLNLNANLTDFVLQTEKYLKQKPFTRLILILIYNIHNFPNNNADNFGTILNVFKLNNVYKNTKLITFRNFVENDLENCIRKEEKFLNISLTDNEFNELKTSIDVKRSGCKTVHAKINYYKRF